MPRAPFETRSIRSFAQTYADWETIVVDDGSTDSTAKIVQRFVRRDGRIQLIRQSNRGESGARNTGVAAARLGVVAFVDADDWIAPTYLERLIAELNANPEFDAVHCGSVRVSRVRVPRRGISGRLGTIWRESYCRPASRIRSESRFRRLPPGLQGNWRRFYFSVEGRRGAPYRVHLLLATGSTTSLCGRRRDLGRDIINARAGLGRLRFHDRPF
jgi:glycosyltransferase involved in cell wall biosynthesis